MQWWPHSTPRKSAVAYRIPHIERAASPYRLRMTIASSMVAVTRSTEYTLEVHVYVGLVGTR